MSDDMRLADSIQSDSPSEKESQLPEEFLSLSGRTQDRIKKLVELKNQALEEKERMASEVERLRSTPQYIPMPQVSQSFSSEPTEEERKALERMRHLGVMTREELEAERARMKEEADARESRRILAEAHAQARQKFSSDEYPTYDPKEVEDFMRERSVYDPEIAYRELYRDEITQIEARKLSSKQSRSQPYTERTRSRIGESEPWTKERIQDRMRQPDGKDWYIKNQDKVDKIIASFSQS